MTTKVLFLRGSDIANNAYTGDAGEVTIDSTNKGLRVHDGVTAGGAIIYGKNQVDVLLSVLEGRIDGHDTDITAVEDAISTINTVSLPSKVDVSTVGVANGVASLDAGGKVPLSQISDTILGQVEWKGLWNADTNTPTLPSTPAENGHYYIADVAGTFEGIEFNVGDWLIANGSVWGIVNNTDTVRTVAGKIGDVVLVRADVGLDQVDNTADADKPVSTAQQAALDLKANLASPAFTGTPTAPTPTGSDDSTKVATTEFVKASITALSTGVSSVTATGPVVVNNTDPANPTVSISAATTSAAGSMSDTDKTKLDGVAAGAQVNVDTDLAIGGTGAAPTITSTTGDAVALPIASSTIAGLMTNALFTKLANIAANAEVNVDTDLAIAGSGDAITITSSTGNNAALPIASGTDAGLLSTADFTKLGGVEEGAQVNTVTSVAGQTGAVTLSKADVGLNLVNNFATADAAADVAATATNLYSTPKGLRNLVESMGFSQDGETWTLDQGVLV